MSGSGTKQLVLDEITTRWEAWRDRRFPDGASDFAKSDLISIDTYSAGCLSLFVANHGKLDRERVDVLRNCTAELDAVIDYLSGPSKDYFAELAQVSRLVLQFVSS